MCIGNNYIQFGVLKVEGTFYEISTVCLKQTKASPFSHNSKLNYSTPC